MSSVKLPDAVALPVEVQLSTPSMLYSIRPPDSSVVSSVPSAR